MTLVGEAIPASVPMEDVDIWFQDESRIGQQGSQTRLWAKKGTRPRVVKQQQFLYQYIFGAVCPSQKTCAAIVLPFANGCGITKHLEEIETLIPQGRHAVVVMDGAGYHISKDIKVPQRISLLFLPPRAPELNPQEQVWQYIKDHFLANTVFKDQKDILERCCDAWNKFARMPDLIDSLTSRD